ncbi:MAG: universal stress protein [Deltaproteobacteria bacterium]|nr:universal stress protein [Deltaproteobacteria bacterium]MBW2073764.1 universal stress protein [Deltaproteobacteria bacterium]RLB81708.1 MAG: hypothetical protein DRH17_08130 [Deltaproteobacteria bacterium]
MGKVLLAIDGITPDKKAFSYAVQLCKRIRAELSVLQIISPKNYGQYLKKVRKRAHHAKRYIEGSMIAATFAEAGEHKMAQDIKEQALKNINQLLPESEKASVDYHLTMKSGNPDKEVINYVDSHRDIVLTIYDAPKEGGNKKAIAREKRTVPRAIRQNLSTPLVVMKG